MKVDDVVGPMVTAAEVDPGERSVAGANESREGMAQGIHDASYTLVSRGAMLLIALCNQSCLAWLLGPASRGSYAVALLFITLLSLTFTFGSHIALEYFVAAKRLTLSEGVTYGLIYGAAGSFVSAVVGIVLLNGDMAFFTKASTESFYLAMVLLPLFYLSNLSMQFLTSLREFRWYAGFLISNALLQLALTLMLLKGFGLGVTGALLATTLTSAATILGALVLFRSKYRIALAAPSWRKLRELFRFGARYYAGNVSNELNVQIGTILLALFASRADIGIFAVATALVTQVEIIPNAVGTVLMPRVVVDAAGRRDLVALCSRVTTIACGALLLVLVVSADALVPILFSSAFSAMVPLIRVIALGVVIRCASKLFVPYLLGMNHPGLASLAVVGGMITNLFCVWLLLPVMGLLGAAVAMTAGYIVSSLMLMTWFSRVSSLGLREIWTFGRNDWTVLEGIMPRIRSLPVITWMRR